ncbi:single-stranded-DNA-specific exonuclease RecJ [Candidatus Shapirobacteria bacterium CG10_big_fil_rev_8_21_14_0_10_38_14]|uniref:Single-stranded-DNA-specific exonuclease RecJ n=1 Tax=Candidatus Shapirobacteria bacterium CG10_big_fil_rev_8_21_14_0_10_38_14 TaxID=1974483 RepID=A0A2M8L641_9BACT|nr:MAG: single-stranded-DNA-specific exonuclease RecJ [Candidatus Shapirobacteria bacterium CG10_big_fil_rev_8_21_14_0_10_38_14]
MSTEEVKKAIARIKKAIKNKEKIVVYGDYDADGICATAMMWETLDKLEARAMPFVPQREEGYGLKVTRIDQMANEGVKLIITVDQGIVQFSQIVRANKIGVDIIVTDHHVLGKKKPKALAIIHTTQLAGVGVAWFFARELLKAFKKKTKFGLDLAVIGTVTDMVPLLGANRSLVKYGLNRVRKTKRIGLHSLYQVAGLRKENIGTYEIGFLIGPRINASGRIQDPMDPLRLLCLRQDEQKASEIAAQLDLNNRQRQTLTEETSLHARELWLKEDGQSSLIFVQNSAYNEGIIGLVAHSLTKEFYRPAIVVSQGEKISRASARSIKEFNIIEAIQSCADLLGPHGGHPMAAGFSVETKKISLLKTRLQQIAETQLDKEKLRPTLMIDAELEWSDLTFNLLNQLERLEPFGQANFQPVFATKGIQVADARLVGADNQHLKLRLAGSTGQTFDAIGFGLGEYYSRLSPEKSVDIAYQLLIDQWNGQRKLQLKIKDIRIK